MPALVRRYLRGWGVAVHVYNQARRKRHGAGPAPRWIAWRAAMCARWIVDGQHRNGCWPLFLR